MTSSLPQNKTAGQSRPRRVRVVLRDGEVIDASIYLNEGQALAPYLSSRKGGWVNLVNVIHASRTETQLHTVLQSEHIMFVLSLDGDIPVFGSGAIPNNATWTSRSRTRRTCAGSFASRRTSGLPTT